MTPLEKIGLAALAVQNAVEHRSEARQIRYSAYSAHGVKPGDSLDEILSEQLCEVTDRYKRARSNVKTARGSLRRLSVAFLREERRKNEQEASGALKQIELFAETEQ